MRPINRNSFKDSTPHQLKDTQDVSIGLKIANGHENINTLSHYSSKIPKMLPLIITIYRNQF